MKRIGLLCCGICIAAISFGQNQPEAPDTLRKDALNVFMDASSYIRKEINFVNYVRDIKDADVYIISTYQLTGAGGTLYTWFLVGQHRFKEMVDTLVYASGPDDTLEKVREGQVRTLKMGLMRYVIKTPLAQHMDIRFTEPLQEEVSTDRWKNWVFGISASGYLSGQKLYSYFNLYGSVSASKVTSEWKVDLDAFYSYGEDKYNLDEGTYYSSNKSKSFNALIVKSLGEHWSIGGTTYIGSSTYRNFDLHFTIAPGIEYDIFPYSESTRKQFRILYSAGYVYNNYIDSTIYFKINESLWEQNLDIAVEVVQKWGSIETYLGWSNYLHDWKKNNLSLSMYLSLRIAKGLRIRIGGGAGMVHDQLSLVKGGATTEEILLSRKELETQFTYYSSFSLTYTFGSIYNNVVNPRFSNSGAMYIYY